MKILKALVLILVLSLLSNAQNNVVFCGTVVDNQGASVPKAKIEAKLEKGKTYKTIADDNGYFSMELQPGLYKIKIWGIGMKKLTFPIKFLPNQSLKCFDIKLEWTNNKIY
jgi:hypothetical protein